MMAERAFDNWVILLVRFKKKRSSATPSVRVINSSRIYVLVYSCFKKKRSSATPSVRVINSSRIYVLVYSFYYGWAIASEERDWKYRLSIYYAKPQDSGTFTCATPRGITNSLTLHVAAVHCDPISVSGMHITVRVEGTRLGHTAIFQCPLGFRVNGTANITCQASGKWSAPVPNCEPVRCRSLDGLEGLEEPHLQLEEHNSSYGGRANSSYGGRAVFSCAWGYRLMGPPGIECELSGNWSGPLPKCVANSAVIGPDRCRNACPFSVHRR
ncbi:Sushi repeat (SCR repeat) [Popillia japonica]|uniref:Sushi repeat (SCR repeat) n=1 Tax=Popillia japonica TaxID=7064 RepID=A0AAW1ME52_POPJA